MSLHPLNVALLCVLSVYLLFILLSYHVTSRRNAAKALQLKCQETPFEKNRWPLGIDNLMRSLAADRAQQFPLDIAKRFEEMNAYTFRYQVLGLFSTALYLKWPSY